MTYLKNNMYKLYILTFLIFIGSIYGVEVVDRNDPCSHTNPCSFTGGDYVIPTQELTSVNGKLEMQLNVNIGHQTYEWLTTHRRTYNGSNPGPIWTFKAGDIVAVKLVNELTEPQKTEKENEQRFPNVTNLHTHGLHISALAPQDDVFIRVHPGEYYNYEYIIHDEQPAGTYWYHAHVHGSTLFQVHSGLAGMIIVEDDLRTAPAHLLNVSCPMHCEHEIRLLFQPTLMYVNTGTRGFANIQNLIDDYAGFRHSQYNTSNGETLEDYLIKNVEYYTTNSQLWPRINITTGQTKRFRMVNAGGGAVLEVAITNQNGEFTKGCAVMEIAYDGVYFDKARPLKLNKTLLIASGRADWLVVCNEPGIYELRSMHNPLDEMSMGVTQPHNQLLLTITVNGPASSTIIPTSLPARQSFVSNFLILGPDEVQSGFVVELNANAHINREKFLEREKYRYKMELNKVQEWHLINTDTFFSHPVHIHVNHFQIVRYNKYSGPYSNSVDDELVMFDQSGDKCFYQHESYTGEEKIGIPPDPLRLLGHEERWAKGGPGTLGYTNAGIFRDVLLVPSMSNITIRFLPHEFTGDVVIHCHLLNHEDFGMMMTVKIVDEGEDLTANVRSGNAYPGTCKRCDPPFFNQENNCSQTTNTTVMTSTPSDTTEIPTTFSGSTVMSTTSSSTTLITTTSSGASKVIKSWWDFITLYFFSLLLVFVY